MNLRQLTPLDRVVDTLMPITEEVAHAMECRGVTACYRYVEDLTLEEMALAQRYGIDIGLVTKALDFGAATIGRVKSWNLPPGVELFLDIEQVGQTPLKADDLIPRINAWAALAKDASIIPGHYVGAGNPLTSKELYALAVQRYWHSCSRVVDRNGEVAEPACGWVLVQGRPPNLVLNHTVNGKKVIVDANLAQTDYRDRSAHVLTAA